MAKKNTIWLFTQESNVDGEIHFNVVPCKDKETALRVFKKEKKWVLKESLHYSKFTKEELANEDDFTIEETDNRYFIMDNCDDYWEELEIEEKEIA